MFKQRFKVRAFLSGLGVAAAIALVPRAAMAEQLVILLPSSGTAIAGQISGNQWVAFQPSGGGACQFFLLGGVQVSQDFRIVGSSGGDVIFAATGNTSLCGFTVQPLVQGSHWMLVFGQDGSDFIMGGSGPSQVMGGNHADIMGAGLHSTAWAVGDGGNDFVFGCQINARLHGGSNDDKLCASSSNTIVRELAGGSGFDCARGGSTIAPSSIEAPCTDAQCTLF
jgi:hypothetical protein